MFICGKRFGSAHDKEHLQFTEPLHKDVVGDFEKVFKDFYYEPPTVAPYWSTIVAVNRFSFQHCALEVTEDEQASYYYVLLCFQKPKPLIHLVPLERHPDPVFTIEELAKN